MLLSQQRITPQIRDLFAFRNGEEVIKRHIPGAHYYWTGSGREALRQILLQVKGRRVGVPAYTCQVVLDAVRRSGAEAVFYDSGVIAEIKDIKKIISQVDVLLVCYNFGFLPELDKISELCKRQKVILIEDCAQALGATCQGKLAGSFGDYAFYSFGISKNIGFCGGMIASSQEMEIKCLKPFPKLKLIKTILEVMASPLFFQKNIYPFSRKLLKKELIKEQEAHDYDITKLAKRVALKQFQRYESILRRRERNGAYCLEELKSLVDFVQPLNGSSPAWLYFAFLVKNKDEFKRKLEKKGIELGEMLTFQCLYGKSKKALEAQEKVLTFALHRDFKEIKFIVSKIKEICNNGNN